MRIVFIFFIVLFGGCSSNNEILRQKKVIEELRAKNNDLQKSLRQASKEVAKISFLKKSMKGVTATIKTSIGDIKVKFFPEVAPLTCYSFILRAESGFYNKTKFHRVIPGFMIQGGDPNSRDANPNDDGQGGPILMQPHEFSKIHHKRGILSTARVGDVTVGAGSQFFIMHADSPHLDQQYTVFGKVLLGMDIVDSIATAKKRKSPRDYPVKPVFIEKIIIER